MEWVSTVSLLWTVTLPLETLFKKGRGLEFAQLVRHSVAIARIGHDEARQEIESSLLTADLRGTTCAV